MIRSISLFFLCAFFAGGNSAFAEKVQETKEKLERQFQDSRSNVIESEKRKRQILSSLFHLNRKIRKMADEKGNLSYELLVQKSQARRIAKKISELSQSIEKQKKNLQIRLRTIYKMRGQGYLRALFSASTPQALDRNVRFLSIIAEKDYELIRSFEKSKRSLVTQRKRLDKKVRALVKTKKNLKKTENQLAQEQRKKSHLVKKIEGEKKWYLSQIKRLRKKTKTLDLDEDSLLSQSLFFEHKGKLIWPSGGKVIRGYGLRQLSSIGVQVNHKGIQFDGGEAREVQSVFPGKVSFSGEVPGHGKVLVVNHSDHYYTVYGNLRDSRVQKGERVRAEQVIAQTNRKGLYFEIRHYSQPENPTHWLRSRIMKVTSKGLVINEG